ncbi:unnamed protein product [Sphagnum jensenii]|uniref:Uncharacterized protein n=1 Tax=Sphagnum jensenii TaxID=128206 RepID=A0ABP1BWX1_9BRYO
MELLLRSRPSPAAAAAAAAAVAASIAFRFNPSHEEEEEEEIGVAMAGSSSANAGMGWPLGLRSCMVAQDAASPRVAEEESSASIAAVAAAAQTSWLQAARLVEEAAAAEQHNLVGGSFNRFLPYLSDASVSAAESSESDSDFQSETVTSSSFFKDSRRITLGSLIGLPMEYSASGRAAAGGIHHHHLEDTHNHGRTRPGGRWSFTIANRSCGIRELLGSCGNCLQASLGESLSEVILMDPQHPIGMSGQSLAACLELERRGDAALQDGANQAASSADGDRRRSSPEWSAAQFVSCDSLLSDAEEEEEEAEEEEEKKGYGSEQAATPFSHSTFSTSRNSNAINGVQRSSSSTMKSFLSTICCHMHPHQQP